MKTRKETFEEYMWRTLSCRQLFCIIIAVSFFVGSCVFLALEILRLTR